MHMKVQTYIILFKLLKNINMHRSRHPHTQSVDSSGLLKPFRLLIQANRVFVFHNCPFALKCFSIHLSIGFYFPLLVKVNSCCLFKVCLVSLSNSTSDQSLLNTSQRHRVVFSTPFGLGLTSVLFKSSTYFISFTTVLVPTTPELYCFPPKNEIFCPPVDDSGQGAFSGNPSPHTQGTSICSQWLEKTVKMAQCHNLFRHSTGQGLKYSMQPRKKQLLDIP